MGVKRAHLVVGIAGIVWMASWANAQQITPGQMREWMAASHPLPNRIARTSFSESERIPPPDGEKISSSEVPEAPSDTESMLTLPGEFGNANGGTWTDSPLTMEEDGLMRVGPFCEQCGHGANFIPVWSIDQRVTIWNRGRPRAIRTSGVGNYVTVDEDQVFHTTGVMGTRSPVFDVAAGYGATVRHYLHPAQENTDLFLEGVYFGFNTWREGRDVYATNRLSTSTGTGMATFGNLFTPYTTDASGMFSGIGGFDRADHHQIYYESRLHNVEVNLRFVPRGRPDRMVLHPNGRWRRQCQPGIYGNYLFGIRYFSLQEQCNFLAEGQTDFYNASGELTDQVDTWGTYDIDTYNEMLGLQFGLDIKYRQCTFEWGAECKVVPAINFAGQKSRIRASDPTTGTSFDIWLRDREDDVAFLGEVSLVGYYHLRPNLSLRISWDMMWAVGVALAAEQLKFDPNPTNRVNTNGVAFYQGLSLGVIWMR